MKEKQKVTGFVFGTIDLEEAKTLALAGEGNYSELKSDLLAAFAKRQETETFMFHLPGKKDELPEAQRRGICQALTSTLLKAGYSWKVTYHSARRLFLVIPRKEGKLRGEYTAKSKWNKNIDDDVYQLEKDGLSTKEIANKLGVTENAIHYILYSKRQRKQAYRQRLLKDERASQFADTAERVFGKEVKQFSRSERKAFCVIGYKKLGIPASALAPHAGLTKNGVKFTAKYARKFDSAKPYIDALEKAIKKGGS